MSQHHAKPYLSETDWAVMYAKYSGELAHYIESFLDDTIDKADLQKLYHAASKQQFDRILEATKQVTEAHHARNEAAQGR